MMLLMIESICAFIVLCVAVVMMYALGADNQ